MMTPGNRFRNALSKNKPLQIVGTVNAFSAIMAESVGHQAIYLSGGACANMSYGLPDLGITSMTDVLEDVRRITAVSELPLLVDIDTGWGSAFNIAHTIREMERAFVSAVHIEDQVVQKRCGHRPNKKIVSTAEMVDRVKAAVDARRDESFFIMARTDAYAQEGLQAALDRVSAYVEAGADGVFAEAMTSIEQYQSFKQRCDVPLLANMTEFGRSPIFSKAELRRVGVDMILYPFTAVRAMNKAAQMVYKTLLDEGSQASVMHTMQTRDELYQYLNYHAYEEKLDILFAENG